MLYVLNQRNRREFTLIALCAFLVMMLLLATAHASTRLGPPDGSKPLPYGYLPVACTETDYANGASAYGPNYGYTWSKKLKAWITAARCYPVWGYLAMSGSQKVKPGDLVTFIAIPKDGSNSGTYAPITKTITWSFSGARRVSGCGASSMYCTVKIPNKAVDDWTWLSISVTMPRTFFIDHPGDLCGGQHICAGVATNAWSFIGIAPKEVDTEISGVVSETSCKGTSCEAKALRGATVTATNVESGAVLTNVTDRTGSYKLLVKEGKWRVTPSLDNRAFFPSATVVTVAGKVSGVNFRTCAATSKTAGSAQDRVQCRIFEVTNGNYHPELALHLEFKFANWDANGPKIILTSGGQDKRVISRSPPTDKPFGIRYSFPYWDEHNGPGSLFACFSRFKATQGGFTHEAEISAPAVGRVAYAYYSPILLSPVKPQNTLRASDWLCENEYKFFKGTDGVVIATSINSDLLVIMKGGAVDFVKTPTQAKDRVCIDLPTQSQPKPHRVERTIVGNEKGRVIISKGPTFTQQKGTCAEW